MATTITPALGQGAVLLQAGPGASPGYSAIDIRRAMSVGLQEGVIDSGSFEVTARGAGANMSVDIAASTGDGAWVKGDSVTAQGLYYVAPHSAVINETIAANTSGNARLDQIILEILDDTHDAGGSNLVRIRVLQGSTAVAGATLDNRTGAAALPNNAIRLADVIVANGAASISNSSIRDRRPWARGVDYIYTRTAGDYTSTSTSFAAIDSTNLAPRFEFSGVPVVVSLVGSMSASSTGDRVALNYSDSVAGDLRANGFAVVKPATYDVGFVFEHPYQPAAGSHKITVQWLVNAGTATLRGTSAQPAIFSVRELVAQNSVNNGTTSG